MSSSVGYRVKCPGVWGLGFSVLECGVSGSTFTRAPSSCSAARSSSGVSAKLCFGVKSASQPEVSGFRIKDIRF